MVRSSNIGFDSQSVVHGNSELLLASEIAFGCLHGYMSQQELNLVELSVARWHKSDPNGMWRKTPIGADLEIKGALLGLDGTEYVPEGKRTRSCQIHCMGFT